MRPAVYTEPLPLPKASWRRRLEVFSPKLDRRLSLGSYPAWRCWVALEANPAITKFCERPARVAGKTSAMLDFWVHLHTSPRGEFWLLEADVDDGARSVAGSHHEQLAPPSRLSASTRIG